MSHHYSSRHQTACFKVAEELQPPHRVVLSQRFNVATFATVRVLSYLHSPELRCLCCNVVRFCCDLEACNLVTATFAINDRY
jgi:hypothetical protein